MSLCLCVKSHIQKHICELLFRREVHSNLQRLKFVYIHIWISVTFVCKFHQRRTPLSQLIIGSRDDELHSFLYMLSSGG